MTSGALVGLYLARRSEGSLFLSPSLLPSALCTLLSCSRSHSPPPHSLAPFISSESVFRLVLYPALGAGLVGGVIYRDRLQAEYKKMEQSYRSSAESWKKDSRKQK